MKKYVNGILTDMTEEEISVRETEEAQAIIDRQTKIDQETDKENNKTSGKAKLKELGLTDAQIDALLGV